jgi:hypothetical protein
MKNIKTYKQYKESVSGTMDTMPYGPGMPRQELKNTLDNSDTELIYSKITDKIYTKDEYDEMYNDYLKKGGKPLIGFNKENLESILQK